MCKSMVVAIMLAVVLVVGSVGEKAIVVHPIYNDYCTMFVQDKY